MRRKLKVLKNHPTITNINIFVILALGLLALQLSLQSHIPFINFDFLIKYFNREWPLFFLGFTLSLTLISYYKISHWIYRVFVIAVAFRALQGLFIDFNKLIFIILFIMIIISYLFDQLLSSLFTKSFYQARYTEESLFPPRDFLPKITLNSNDEEIFKGHMTNWDSEGFFVRGVSTRLIIAEDIHIVVEYGGKIFPFEGSIVSISDDLQGCGIIVVDTDNKTKWNDYIDMMNDLGLDPQLTR